MKIIIKEASPDGLLVNFINIHLDTYKDIFEIIKLMESIRLHNKIDIAKVMKMLKDLKNSRNKSEEKCLIN